MLSKLFKYEMKATARIFLPLYLVLLAYSIVHNIVSVLSPNDWKAPELISMIVYVMMLVGIMVMTLIVIIQRFYKNLLSEEGYLMFTLPTKTWKHIVSKLIASMIWTSASALVAVASICIVAFSRIMTGVDFNSIIEAVDRFFRDFGLTSVPLFIEILLICLVSLASNVLIIYASIAVGHLFNQHRVILSLGAFIGLNAVSQIIMVIVATIGSRINIPSIDTLNGKIFTAYPIFHIAIWFIILFFGLMAAGYFALTNYILNNRLNLE